MNAIEPFPSTLVGSKAESTTFESIRDSSLTPRGTKHCKLYNAIRLVFSTGKLYPATVPVSGNLFTFSGVGIQSHDDSALGKREDLVYCLLLIRGEAGSLFVPHDCAEVEYLVPT